MSRWYLTSFLVVALASVIVAIEIWRTQPVLDQAATETTSELPGTKVKQPETSNKTVEVQPVPNDSLVESPQEAIELWQVMDEIPANAPPIRRDVPDKQLVRLDPEALRNIKQGARVPVVIPDLNEPVEVAITRVEVLASGNTSILGKVNDNALLDFVATIGDNSTYATIGTELGVYNLRGNRELAWIATGRAFNHHVDPSVLDYVIPEKPEPLPAG